MARKLMTVSVVCAIAAASPWAILFGVDAAMGEAPRRFERDRCTRSCHDHGCRHRPVLPAALASDEGLFGLTVRALHGAGGLSGLGPGRGYGFVNLLVFCWLWPLWMLALVAVVVWQRLTIRELRASRGGDGDG